MIEISFGTIVFTVMLAMTVGMGIGFYFACFLADKICEHINDTFGKDE